MSIIYKHTNKSNGKSYIGKTTRNPDERYKNGKGYKKHPYFNNAIEKYGWDNFETIILENVSNNKIDEREIYWIGYYDTTNRNKGYNLTKGGEGITGYKHTLETKEKISKKMSGKSHPQYGITKDDSEILDRKSFYELDYSGNIIKEYFGVNISSSEIGISRANLSQCLRGFTLTANNRIFIHKDDYSEIKVMELIRKVKNKKKSNAQKVVIQFSKKMEKIQEWNSCSEAGRKLGISGSKISSCATYKQNTSGGFVWRYK